MPSNIFSLSSALCLALAIGPASVLSAPQLNGLPLLGGDNDNVAPTNGDSEHDAGAGFDVGIPGGPGVQFGAGTHSEHHGPCGPGPNGEHDAGSGFNVGLPGGPHVRFGAGTHDEYDAVPCPEPTTVEPTIVEPTIVEPTIVEPTTAVPVMEPPIPPTYTTPIVIPTVTTPPAYAPPTPIPVHSTPLISRPSSSPSPRPVFNAGSALAPSSSLLAVALPIILGMFY